MKAVARNAVPLVFFLLCSFNGLNAQISDHTFVLEHIQSDSLFQSSQRIHVLTLKENWEKHVKLGIFQPTQGLSKTSEIASTKDAVAAVNGSFFNRKAGTGVVYLESEGVPLAQTISGDLDFLQNGAIRITHSGEIHIGEAHPDLFYQNSTEEAFVLVSGPLLLQNGEAIALENHAFVTNRHPRTCICQTPSELKFVVVDGRSSVAHGMRLPELQKFLLEMGCVDALNLDGGGSST
ncbi:MAG: phosphodiester glycosidase family protein [Bacteroidota bacterium]